MYTDNKMAMRRKYSQTMSYVTFQGKSEILSHKTCGRLKGY